MQRSVFVASGDAHLPGKAGCHNSLEEHQRAEGSGLIRAASDALCPEDEESSELTAPLLKHDSEPLLRAQAGDDVRAGAVVDRAGEKKDNTLAGMLWYAASSFFFTGMGACSKGLGALGYPVWEITLFRAIIIFCFTASVLMNTGESPFGNRKLLLFMRGTLGFTSVTCFYTACNLLPLADATTFTFLAPLVVALLSPFLLKERTSPVIFGVIPVCIFGVLLITQPSYWFGSGVQQLSTVGVAVGLTQPFFSATAKMTVRELRKTETVNVMVFNLMLCTLVFSTVGCLLAWEHLVVPHTWAEAGIILLLGVFGYGNQVCITNGLANAKAASVMCMQYFSIVISQVVGMLVFSEFTNWYGCVGMALIVGAMVVLMVWESRRKASER